MLSGNLYAGQISIAPPYHGLNDSDPTVTLADGESQDLLNVEVSKDGNSIVKRSGYSLLDTMSVAPTTAPIHGSIMFRNSAGDNIEVYASDVAVYKSVNSSAYSQFITTATVGAKWSFCAGSGIVYAFNDKHDEPFSYDGTTVVYYPGMPKASLCAMTPTRMLIAGTTDYPNRLYFSGEGDYTNFTLGIEPEDPSFDDIGMSGDKITGLWANASEWLIWKTNSMISYQGTNQYDLVASVISNKVGLSDPQARVEHGGVIYFRGTDAKIWAYSGGMLADTTKKLETFTANSTKDVPRSRQYLTKSTWDLGTFNNTASTITNGAIEPWLVGFTDTTDDDFEAGTGSSVTIELNAITLSGTVGRFSNIGFENGTFSNWTEIGDISTATSSGFGSTPPSFNSNGYGTITPWFHGGVSSPPLYRQYLYYTIYDGSDTVINTNTITLSLDNTFLEYSIDLSTYTQETIKISFGSMEANPQMTSVEFAKPNTLQFAYYKDGYSNNAIIYVDFKEEVLVTSASFASRTFDTGTTTKKYCYLASSRTVISQAFLLLNFQSSSDSVTWGSLNSTTDYLSNPTTNQYIRYGLEFIDSKFYSKPSLTAISINCVATGTWTSDEFYAGNFTNWGQFLANATLTGNATWTYQISTSAIAGGTGSNWYSIQTSSAIGIPISPYVKVRASSSFTSSTETVRLNNISYSYNITTAHLANGFEYLGDIFFSVPYSGSTTNNRVMKYDINAEGWTIFDIPMNAPLISGNNVHFGSPTDGKIYTYPSGNNDNGAAINAYWKSRDFMGDNVYVNRTFDKLSLFMDSDYASDVDVTYNIEPSTSITYNINLTQTDGSLYIRNNRQLPAGTSGSIFNLKLSNNAVDKPFRFYGSVIDYTNDGWTVYP